MKNMDKKAFEWLNGNQLSYDIWNKKYRYKNETFEAWLNRVSGGDKKVQEIIKERKFLFGGRTLASRNTGNGMSFSNCYSSGYAPDSVEGMLELNKKLALTYQASGGQGLSLSLIRPKGADVRGGLFKSDGIVPFMEIFNQTTASISQGGSRKGALMMSLSIWHPEIETFISIKDGTGKITKANLSVEIDDKFMQLVDKGVTEYKYITFGREYTINPTDLYNKIMQRAWSSAEPGVIFTNKFRKYNLMELHNEYEIITSNPCGEQPLPANGACNLGSMNLAEYVIYPFTKDACFDFDTFSNDVMTCVRALDDVLEEGRNLHALEEQREMAKNYRNIGLGVMGYATMLMKMGLAYGSENSKKMTDSIMKTMIDSALMSSALLAKERGVFPKYDSNILKGNFYKNISPEVMALIEENGLRNCSLLSVAPSGSIGTMLDVSTGLEPYYALSYQRKTESLHGDKDVYYTVEVPTAKQARESFGDDVCVSAMDINWHDRVEVQGIMQKYIDTAISSTVNVPNATTVEELRDLYLFAWKCGLKGITIYRDGSFEAILSTGKTKKEQDANPPLKRGEMEKVPSDTIYIPKTMNHGCGRAKVMIGFSPSRNKVIDVYYINKGEGGCTKNTQGEAILISQILRTGGNLEDIKKSFAGIDPCSSCVMSRMKGKQVDGINCPNILLNLVINTQKELQNKIDVKIEKEDNTKEHNKMANEKAICPECGSDMEISGGCYTCKNCGYSKCD